MFRARRSWWATRCARSATRSARRFEAEGISTEVSLLVGGQIRGQPMRLFLVYSAGNFIECGPDAPFLQIGEYKYGKPILDRAVTFDTDLADALKLGLLSFDSTMRSNLAVGLPLDVIVVRRDALAAEIRTRIPVDDPYFHELGERWARRADDRLPRYPAARPTADRGRPARRAARRREGRRRTACPASAAIRSWRTSSSMKSRPRARPCRAAV